ncbi:MAG: reactive intermediate/imine deaminase [Candidatus Nealsonbacteria bacterium]|nr:MAG: reactive intermediate/imine deaminase [Candidatus Nealsonbacteria bacterium]
MKKEIIISKKVPAAIGPYSSALKIGNLVFVSGQLPIDPVNGEIIKGEIEIQARRSLENLKAVLESYSVDIENVVKTTIFLKNMNKFSRVNKIYGEYFTGQFPARSCVEVSRLPKDADIEIEAIAFCD